MSLALTKVNKAYSVFGVFLIFNYCETLLNMRKMLKYKLRIKLWPTTDFVQTDLHLSSSLSHLDRIRPRNCRFGHRRSEEKIFLRTFVEFTRSSETTFVRFVQKENFEQMIWTKSVIAEQSFTVWLLRVYIWLKNRNCIRLNVICRLFGHNK